MLFMMKSEKVKKVVLKNPHLRNLRKNLKTILRLAYNDKMKWYYGSLSKMTNGSEFSKKWQRFIEGIEEAFHKSTLGCQASGGCLTYQALLKKKIKEGAPKKNAYFFTIGRQYYEHLSVEELMDVDLVWVNIDGLNRWVCTKCYEDFKKFRDLTKGLDYGEGIDS